MHRIQHNMTDESWRSLTNMPLFCDPLYSSQSHLVGHLLLTTLRKSSLSLQVPVENEQLELHKTTTSNTRFKSSSSLVVYALVIYMKQSLL